MEVHYVSDNVGEWITIIEAPPSFDLMAVIGVEEILGSANVTPGKYTQIRMDVDRVEVVTTAGDNITAEVPSGKLKIVRPFTVEAGVTTVLTLDFDGEKSLVLPGKDVAAAAQRALFKPVVKLLVEAEVEEGEIEVEIEVAEETGDTTPPVVTLTGVTEGEVIVSPDTVTPVFSVSDDTDPDPTLTARLNGQPFTSGTEVSDPGEYELELTAKDAGDNEVEVKVNFEIVPAQGED
jgi:hypothetical protein